MNFTVDLTALQDRDPSRNYVTLNDGGSLDLHPVIRPNCSPNFPSDDRFLGFQVSFYQPAGGEQDLLGGADATLDGALDLDDSLGLDISSNRHSGSDYGESAFTAAPLIGPGL